MTRHICPLVIKFAHELALSWLMARDAPLVAFRSVSTRV